MGLEKLLAENKNVIIKKWFEQVVDTYPSDTSNFLKKQKDPFANPVGNTTRQSLDSLFDEILKKNPDKEAIRASIDPVIRIRAVQTMFSPSQAVSFPYFLKNIIRDYLQNELKDTDSLKTLLEFELKIDMANLIAFDIFVQCRETVWGLRANHEKTKIYKAFSRAGLVEEIPENRPGL
ncbi:RsbT co-antagonist protein N-terminal domain-containing protein [Desulfonema limicola]|uniref:RsbT co-antagonist protein N-terminal domain-containing protein n=1 Tax=Desulfonema limicola TaxID=45656 RepID=A0A975GJF5_9BACT|nr:RsbRD N-terminal domain-containing protein [Desulfonema limicola]QTA83666.1 RsbT co-antagonist protein N-terminal domain-containing protein [Desulfonema limicola]